MLNGFSIVSLIENKNFDQLKLYVGLGFDISLTEQNKDSLEKFGTAENIVYKLIISNELKLIKKQPSKLLSTQNENGYTPLHWAIITQRNAITDYIVSECSNHLSETKTGENCFSLAARYDNAYAFNKLMDMFQCDAFTRINELGFNALLFAASRKNSEILERCLKNCEPKHLKVRNVYGDNFFHCLFHGRHYSDATKKSLAKIVSKIIDDLLSKTELTTMLQEKNELGYTPMAWLKHYDNRETLQFMENRFYSGDNS